MPEIETSVCVKYTPDEMYALVNDVESYPKYIPMCSDAKLLEAQPDRLKASIRRMNGVWRFDPLDTGGCEVDFKLHFEFASAMLSLAFNGLFKEVTESMVSAFCKQAALKYGPRP